MVKAKAKAAKTSAKPPAKRPAAGIVPPLTDGETESHDATDATESEVPESPKSSNPNPKRKVDELKIEFVPKAGGKPMMITGAGSKLRKRDTKIIAVSDEQKEKNKGFWQGWSGGI